MEPNIPLKNKTKDMIFSLDIGTRTVIGLVGYYDNNRFEILDAEIIEHDKRNMYDGQIHDIAGVTQIVKKVKDNLEGRLGIKLDKVAIAAAGRALRTHRVKANRDIDSTLEISKRLIESLEMEAIQQAQDSIDNSLSKEDSRYYCVGYTVVNYYLDNSLIENLEGHRGNRISTDVIATFLPHTVVDSLYTVMSKVGLEVINMTLEPIAAIKVAIKKSLRLLNLALVDIGAGTSDIAITKNGTIVAYAMASIAGDEITERIATNYLLDFDAAEKLKISLVEKGSHCFTDIVDISYELTTNEILDTIKEAIEGLAKEIADKIIEYNEKAPSAVFLIGGGSQIPGLAEYISAFLGMPKERVVIRDTSIVENIDNIPDMLKGPHAITPIGIAITAIDNKYKDFLELTVNGEKIKLFNSKDIKVSDALILFGYNPRKLIPSRGDDLTFYINKALKTIRGSMGEPARILVNGIQRSLEYILKADDIVEVTQATKGNKARVSLYDCIEKSKVITFNGREVDLVKYIRVNGETTDNNIEISENDKVDIFAINSIKELLVYLGYDINKYIVYRNGHLVEEDTILDAGDTIIADMKKEEAEELKSNNEKLIRLLVNRNEKLISYSKDKFIFVDVFNYIDFDLSKVRGNLILKVNGSKADYIQELNDGDELEIYWQ